MDPELARALAEDDAAEDRGMHPDDRRTCHTHQGWAETCAHLPEHSNPHGYVLSGMNRR